MVYYGKDNIKYITDFKISTCPVCKVTYLSERNFHAMFMYYYSVISFLFGGQFRRSDWSAEKAFDVCQDF